MVVLAALGCAQERGAINRVQADALDKSFFIGADFSSAADDPEFYKRGTVIDVSYGAGSDGLFTATYAQPVSRIRWEITEDTLNARLSYERINGTDGKGNTYSGATPKTTNDGQIVASYKILSHFDIKHDYNPQTGEQLNIVVENTTDRVWYQRQYFRVDWSTNLVTTSYDYDSLSMLGVYGAVTYEPYAYTVLDPNDPNAPHFDSKNGYFDVTNKAYAKPQTVDLSSLGFGPGQFPACMLPGAYFHGGSDPWGDCNPVEITIRESYRKVVDTDYEAFDFDGVRFQNIGAFNFDYRRSFDRHYGLLDQDWSRFLARYNIWQRSHFYADPVKMTGPVACATKATTEDPTGDPTADPNRDTNGNGTADECEAAGSGSRCDLFRQQCTLPYASRQAVTIPWYLTGDPTINQDLFEPTDWAVQEWDLAMKAAVQTDRLVECKRTGGTDCYQKYPVWNGQQDDNDEGTRISRQVNACRRTMGWTNAACDTMATDLATAVAMERKAVGDPSIAAIGTIVDMQPVFTLCHNPVNHNMPDGDHPACGPQGFTVRQGDLRYHTVQNIPNPQTPSAWGIMVDADDPLTGEKVSGSMNIWTAVTDQAAQALVDLVRYANGEIPTSAVTNAQYIDNWVAGSHLAAGAGLPTMSRAEVNQRLAGGSALDLGKFTALYNAPVGQDVQAVLQAGRARVADVQARNDLPSPGWAKVQATLAQARGTGVETQLLNPAIYQIAGVGNATSLVGPVADQVSPLALNNPMARARLHDMRENALAARGACVVDEAPEPTSMSGLADVLAAKFPKGQNETPAQTNDRTGRMFNYVRSRYHYAVLAHEMGHSVGLRHNFVSSSAPLFYRPQYWQLRTKNGAVTTPCTDAVADGSTCVGPRYWDPVTTEEQSQLIWMWMQSTVMDYPGDNSQDFLGLGVTDFAAARFFYGDNVPVYTNPNYAPGTAVGGGLAQTTDTFGGIVGIKYGLPSGGSANDFHYSQLQKNYSVIGNCYTVTPAPPPGWDESKDGVWSPVLDGKIVSIDGSATKCREQPVDWVGYTQLRQATTAEAGGQAYSGGPNVFVTSSGAKQLRVPFSFASDNWADTGNASVFRHDNGADPYEQVQFLINTQEDRHIFDNYRRGRTSFSLIAASDRSFQRYTSKMQGLAGGVGFLASIYRDIGTGGGFSFDSLWPVVIHDTAEENVIASTLIFDHFVRMLARPEPGEHYKRAATYNDPVLHSNTDPDDFGPPRATLGLGTAKPLLVIPNGSTGFLRDIGFGGRPIENNLATNQGDFNVEYIENCGSYYDKINTAYLLAQSEDRYISQSRRDFYDARFRAVGVADVFPDGFRRVLGNALTGDRSILGPRIAADATGSPILNSTASTATDPLANRYPKSPLGWPSFWPAGGANICFSAQGRNICNPYFSSDAGFGATAPTNTAPIDPQVGWEVQKFMMAWSVALIKANEKTDWMDSMRIYRVGQETDPGITPRIEWQDPASGQLYVARDLGSECLFGDATKGCAGGQVVQKGVAARVLQYANQLTARGYKLDVTNYPAVGGAPAGFNQNGRAVVLRQPSGSAIVLADPNISDLSPTGTSVTPIADCDQNVDPTCTALTPQQNMAAYELQSYKSVPDYLWQAELVYGWFNDPSARGTF
jgi:hypothetical protein